ncbi:hypothetical protein FBY34_5413 [Streptomyces sp. SLBN-115]|nr:hypothetical protein FBY34_5413 [Streptomyces sp. SLBN-115]
MDTVVSIKGTCDTSDTAAAEADPPDFAPARLLSACRPHAPFSCARVRLAGTQDGQADLRGHGC